MAVNKRKIFRWLIDTFDGINFWFEDKFNLNPKRAVLERNQDLTSVEELERTIGKSLNIKKPV